MHRLGRRKFVRNSSVALAVIAWSRLGLDAATTAPLISFSTLACPKWSFANILSFAADHGYHGVELRGILGELDLTKRREFSRANLAASRRLIEDHHQQIVCLGSSAALHHADAKERARNLDEARRFIDLAQQLDCPHVRVFPDALPGDQDRTAAMDRISKGLLELADEAKGSKVDVLLESHGDLVATEDLLRIMQNSESPHAGMVWDICNMWSVTKEAPALAYARLKPYIRHTHIKDLTLADRGRGSRYVLLGTGDAPVAEALRALAAGGYSGYYSFEWEKLWHPEIDEPEIALSHYATEIRKYF